MGFAQPHYISNDPPDVLVLFGCCPDMPNVLYKLLKSVDRSDAIRVIVLRPIARGRFFRCPFCLTAETRHVARCNAVRGLIGRSFRLAIPSGFKQLLRLAELFCRLIE